MKIILATVLALSLLGSAALAANTAHEDVAERTRSNMQGGH